MEGDNWMPKESISTVTSYGTVEQMVKEEKAERKTDWRAIVMATVVTLFSSVETNIVSVNEWQYLREIDHDATSSFVGLINSISRLGHALFVFVFAIWASRWHVHKAPLLFGRAISLVGSILYILVELFPSGRRFVLLTSYFLFGIGYSVTAILRNYITVKSSAKDRTKAFAMFYTAALLSTVIGPIAQLAFSGIKYPGFQIVGPIRFHIYSAPMWFAVVTNIICTLLIIFVFQEPTREDMIVEESSEVPITLSNFKERIISLKDAPFSWPVVIAVIVQKAFGWLSNMTLQSTVAPTLMAIFGNDGTATTQILSIAQFIVALLALALTALFVFAGIGNRIPLRIIFLAAYAIIILNYVFSFPWPFISHPLKPYDPNTHAGCNPEEYSWCIGGISSQTSSMWVYLVCQVIAMGVAAPALIITLDSTYSKVLTDGVDQSMMQGIIVMTEDIFLVLSPLYVSSVFASAGMAVLWICNFSICAIAVLVWIALWKPIGRLTSNKKL